MCCPVRRLFAKPKPADTGWRGKRGGFALIEVLISVLVFALGVTALLNLQGKLLKSTGLAQARSVASQLAEAKIEDLRSFTTFQSADATTVFGFTAIGNNAGGGLTSGTLTLPATGGSGGTTGDPATPTYNLNFGGTAYSRNWTVSDYYYSSAAALVTVQPAAPFDKVAQKRITVNIGWVDSDGTAQKLSRSTVINMNGEISGATGTFSKGTGSSGERPVVAYTASTDARVTPIQVGTSVKRETLVPGSTTIDGYVSTAFQSNVYNNSGELIRTEEFKNVACACAFDGVSTDADEARAPSYPAWSAVDNTYVDITGVVVAGKAKGCPDANGNGSCDANPSVYCTTCCRDHHDVPSSTSIDGRKNYDPYRSGDVNADGTAKKYYGTTTPVSPTATGQSGRYYDACRLKRIDGYWRVYQDWNMVNLTTLPLADLEDASKKSSYSTYVGQVVDAVINQGNDTTPKGNATSGGSFTQPALPDTLDHTTSSSRVSLSVGGSANSSARSIYVDYVDLDFLNTIRAQKAAGSDYLVNLPFYEVDNTVVASWQSAQTAAVRVGPTGPPTNMSAGQISGLATYADGPVGIAATLRKSNSGLTNLSVSVDYGATSNADTESMTSRYDVCIGCSGGSGSASCTGAIGGTLLSGATRAVYSESTGTCTVGSISCANGVLSGDTGHQYTSCTVGQATCTTTVTGGSPKNSDQISVSVISPASTQGCTVTSVSGNKGAFSCPAMTTSTGATISVTRTWVTGGNTNTSTSTLTSICGNQTVNF